MNNLADTANPNIANHLSDACLAALREGRLNEKEALAASSHISCCSLCAERLVSGFSEDELLKVPAGFTENTLALLKPEKENKRYLLFYSIKVAAAVCATLVLIFSGVLNSIEKLDEKIHDYGRKGQYVADVVNVSLKNFTDKILELEDYENES
ncbi:MAG: hypothetical protein ACM3XR_06890 [Bacillota bacterium]